MSENILPVSENCLYHCPSLRTVLMLSNYLDSVGSDDEETPSINEVMENQANLISLEYLDEVEYLHDSDRFKSYIEQTPENDKVLIARNRAIADSVSFSQGLIQFMADLGVDLLEVEPQSDEWSEQIQQNFAELFNQAIGKTACNSVIEIEGDDDVDREIMIPVCPLRKYVIEAYAKRST